jgi:hypothetical protein
LKRATNLTQARASADEFAPESPLGSARALAHGSCIGGWKRFRGRFAGRKLLRHVHPNLGGVREPDVSNDAGVVNASARIRIECPLAIASCGRSLFLPCSLLQSCTPSLSIALLLCCSLFSARVLREHVNTDSSDRLAPSSSTNPQSQPHHRQSGSNRQSGKISNLCMTATSSNARNVQTVRRFACAETHPLFGWLILGQDYEPKGKARGYSLKLLLQPGKRKRGSDPAPRE